MFSSILIFMLISFLATSFLALSKKKIMILMNLEMLMVFMIMLIFVMSNNSSNNFSPFMCLVLVMVTESVLGLSIMTSASRNSSLTSTLSKSWF